jgi:lysophospholipase L1-like esterase
MKKILLLSEMEDGLHPNSEGHIKMYKKMKKILKQNKK